MSSFFFNRADAYFSQMLRGKSELCEENVAMLQALALIECARQLAGIRDELIDFKAEIEELAADLHQFPVLSIQRSAVKLETKDGEEMGVVR